MNDQGKPGRPTTFTKELADILCERIADGESLRAICREESMPNKATVFRWLALDKSFSDQYAKARETQADSLFDEILTIADDSRSDTYLDDHGNMKTDQEVIGRARLRVDARKWMAGKLRPKVYGEKSTTELVGPNGGPVEFSVIERKIVRPD
jgi:hypothetical protein